jgi:EmrB/QacA subfamily drug resistance transporter
MDHPDGSAPGCGTALHGEARIALAANRRILLTICAMSSFLTPFMGSAINLALPAISADLSMNAVLLGWVATAYNLAVAIFLVPLGRIADIRGRERVFKIGIICFGLFSIISTLATTGTQLIAARFLQGIGGAMIFGTSTAILTSAFPAQERGRVLGINISVVYIGSSLGPLVGGVLTHGLGWRSLFYLNAAIAAVVIAFAAKYLAETSTGQERLKFDLGGSLVYGFSLSCIMLGFTFLPSIGGWLALAAGIASIVLFGFLMTRIESPVLDIKVFRKNTAFIFSNLAALINYSATFAIGFLLSLYLQYIKGFPPSQAGMVMVVQPIIMAAFTPLTGRLSDRIEPRILATLGMACTAMGLGAFAFLGRSTPLYSIIACLVFIGLGLALFSSPNTNAAMSAVEKKYYGVASATIGTMRIIGMMLSMGTIMMILALAMGRTRITPEYYDLFLHSARIGFAVFAALCFLGVFASYARGNVRPS